MLRQVCLLFLLGWSVVSTGWADATRAFQEANKLYDVGQFEAAIAHYESIAPKTAHVFYNLGNAYFRSGQFGRALVNFERARRLAPRDPDIGANLKFAEQRLGVDEAIAAPLAERWLRSLAYSQTLNQWTAYELITLWLLIAAGAGLMMIKRNRALIATAAVVGGCLWIVSAVALGFRTYEHRHAPLGVVVAKSVEARFAPLPQATKHFSLKEGDRVRIREDRGEWILVERGDRQQGWMPVRSVETVNVP